MSTSRLLHAGILGVILGGLLLAAWVGATALAARGLYADARAAEALLASGPANADVEAAGALLHSTRRHLVALDRNVGWLAPLGRAFGWVPRVGPLAQAAPELLALGDALSELGVVMWDDLAPALAAYQADAPLPELLPDAIAGLSAGAAHKQVLIVRAQVAYDGIDVATMPGRVAEPLALLGRLLPLMPLAMEGAEVAPTLLGFEAPQTYLLLALNEDELRPGGGFISGVGEIGVAAGDVVSMTFRDAYAVDDFTQPYPDPPAPLRHFMGLQLWVFRDANWSPDFPTATAQALPLYRPGYPVTVDGVIAMDQIAVSALIGALEPLHVPGVDTPVTGATLLDYIHTAWAPDDSVIDDAWWTERKSFMGDLAAAAMQRVKSGDVDWAALLEAVMTMLDERHIQLMFEHPQAQALLARQGWSGALAASEGDFLMPVEANVGYNKTSPTVNRSLTYEVDLRGPAPQAAVTLEYRHRVAVEKVCDPRPRYDASYEAMMTRCYWAYVRLFVPQGATLRDASRHPIAAGVTATGQPWPGAAQVGEEADHTVFGQALFLPTAAEASLTFTYDLPPSVVQATPDGGRSYSLVIQKQAGVRALDAHVLLRIPEDAVLLSVTPTTYIERDNLLSFDLTSTRDIVIRVDFK